MALLVMKRKICQLQFVKNQTKMIAFLMHLMLLKFAMLQSSFWKVCCFTTRSKTVLKSYVWEDIPTVEAAVRVMEGGGTTAVELTCEASWWFQELAKWLKLRSVKFWLEEVTLGFAALLPKEWNPSLPSCNWQLIMIMHINRRWHKK